MRWFFYCLMAMMSLACGQAAQVPVREVVAPTTVVSDTRPTMGEFAGVSVPNVPDWEIRAVGPVPIVVARTMRDPGCGAFIVIMARPGSVTDGAWIKQMIVGASNLPPEDGVAIELAELSDGYLFGRTTTEGMVAWVGYRSFMGSQGSVLVRIAGRWAPRCGEAAEIVFKSVVLGITAN